MKRSRVTVENRRRKVLDMITKSGDVKVGDIATLLHVSPLTIRRDLQYLEDSKLLERYYGGARIMEEREEEASEDKVMSARRHIAKYAASLVEDGDHIFINTSSTAIGMLSYIEAKDVTVITNNGNAINMKHSSNVTVILTGGELRYVKGTMVGDFALNSLMGVTAKKSFVGCSGLSAESGMTSAFSNEVQINGLMLSRVTEKAYILADYQKIGQNSNFVSCPIHEVTNIITDTSAEEETVAKFRERGINVYQVNF